MLYYVFYNFSELFFTNNWLGRYNVCVWLKKLRKGKRQLETLYVHSVLIKMVLRVGYCNHSILNYSSNIIQNIIKYRV